MSHKCVDELFCRRVVSIPTWGRFWSTHGLKAEPEVHLCGEFHFVTQEYPNLLPWGIWVSAQRGRSIYDLSFSVASRYPGKRTNVYHHRWRDGELFMYTHLLIVCFWCAKEQIILPKTYTNCQSNWPWKKVPGKIFYIFTYSTCYTGN